MAVLETIVSVATVISAASTAIYTWITRATLKELKSAREQNARPKIVIFTPTWRHLYLITNKNGDLFPGISDGVYSPSFHSYEKYEMKNVGFAPAFNIKIVWSIGGDELNKLISMRDTFYNNNAEIDSGSLRIGSKTFKVENSQSDFSAICIATQNTEDRSSTQPPESVLNRFIFNFFFKEKHLLGEYNNIFIRAEIEYEDINGTTYTDTYRFDPKIDKIFETSDKQPFIGVGGAANVTFWPKLISSKTHTRHN